MAMHLRNTNRLPFLAKKDGVAWDISTATTKQLFMQAPDGTILEKTLTFTTDGTNGLCEYSVPISDITVSKNWRVEAYIVCGGLTLDSDPIDIAFEDNLRGLLT